MLMQTSTSRETGNTVLTMWICDLVSQQWTELVSWDLGYASPYINTYGLGGFMENYLTSYNGSVRNVSFSNIRGRSAESGRWHAAGKVRFTVNNSIGKLDYMGSYNFDADDSSFWIITSAVEGLCRMPKNGSTYSVQNASTSEPY